MTSSSKAPGASKVCPRCERAFPGDITFCPHDGARLIAPSVPDSLVGRTIEGRFTITGMLGAGGMGAVYLARARARSCRPG